MSDYKMKIGERENDTPFENSYQVWMMLAPWAFFPGIINSAIFAGGNGWWFCLFVIGLLIANTFSEKFKQIFKEAKWFRVLIYVNLSAQVALFILSMIISVRLVSMLGLGVGVILILLNYFNVESYIECNRIPN